MILVSWAKASECFGIMPNNYGFHTIGNGGLPRIVFPHSLVSAALVQRNAIAVLPTNRLPSKRAKGLTHGSSIFRTLQNLGIRDWRHPKIGTGIPRNPGMGGTAPAGGHFIE